jgi:hypothetical protein
MQALPWPILTPRIRDDDPSFITDPAAGNGLTTMDYC